MWFVCFVKFLFDRHFILLCNIFFQESNAMVSHTNIVPTVLDWFGIKYPTYKLLHKPVQLTGKSLLPVLMEEPHSGLTQSLPVTTYMKWQCITQIDNISWYKVGPGGSVGCAVRLETRRSRVQPPPRSATFFRGDWSWNIFYGHSLPSADSRRAVVSFWRKNVHNTG